MIRSLSNLNENIKIDVIVEKGCESLLWNHPNINKIIIREKRKYKIKIFRVLEQLILAFKIRNKYDLFFDFTRNLRFFHILSLRIMKPKYLIGCYRNEKFGIKKDELTIFDKYIDMNKNDHAVDINMKALEGLGLDISNRKYELYLGELEDKYKNYFDKNKINIVFNFLGSSQGRCLTDEDIEIFCQDIPKINKNIEVHLLTIPSIYDKMYLKLEELKLERVKLLPKTKNILEAAAIIKYSDMLFSVDTGVVHIASVYNIPIVAIYTEDEDTLRIFAPKSDISSIIIGKKEENLKIIAEIAGDMFDDFLEKTQRQYERGSLYLVAELEVNDELENYIEMDKEELKVFYATTLRTLKKFLGDDLNRMGIFESYSIIEKIKYSYTGKVKKIILTVETTVKS